VFRTRVAACAALIIVFALVVLPGLHPDDRVHAAASEPGLAAFSADLEGWAHDPNCALCRVTSQVRTALHDPADRNPLAPPSAGLRLQEAGEIARSTPVLRGPRARAPPSA
jgi:hypothetical protein